VQTKETEDSLKIFPLTGAQVYQMRRDTRREEDPQIVAFDTYDDHRMAMAFALVACAPFGIIINDPGCVRKTYPSYFSVLERISKKFRFKDSY
jgi:5-enolpyruvylshikimate-3-phosphate synthase